MWYNGIRLALAAVIFLLIYFLVRKAKAEKRKRTLRTVFVVCFGCVALLGLTIIENLVTFPTPNAVFNYNRIGKIDVVIEGERSVLITYSKANESRIAFYPKTDVGYKLDTRLKQKNAQHMTSDSAHVIDFVWINETDDCYIIVTDMAVSGNVEIYDNYNSEFKYVKAKLFGYEKYNIEYYAYIANLSIEDYRITIGENTYGFDDFVKYP